MVATETDEPDPAPSSLRDDQEAFESLIREHQKMIHALCYRMTGSLADAEDLAQETFIHAYRHLKEFRGDAKLSSWLYRIAVNLCLNWRKRAGRQARLHEEFAKETGSGRGEDCDRGRLVQEALLQLDPKQRAAVILTCYDGLSHAEAAQALGCSETTVSWRVFAAKRSRQYAHFREMVSGNLQQFRRVRQAVNFVLAGFGTRWPDARPSCGSRR